MRISEVCRRTELTERTVRYYEEEGLIKPSTYTSGERTYRDYGENDIVELETISKLRKLLFTIDEIKTMKNEPDLIAGILEDYKTRLAEMAARMNDVLDTINRLDMSYVDDIYSLARGFTVVASSRRVPHTDELQLPAHEIEPNFGRFDDEEADPNAAEEFWKMQGKTRDRGEKMMVIIGVVEIVLAIVNIFLDFSGGSFFNLIVMGVIIGLVSSGRRWARYLMAVLSLINVFSLVFVLGVASEIPWLFVFVVLVFAWRCVLVAWLFGSKSLGEYLDYNRG